jgi:hypothetical protein
MSEKKADIVAIAKQTAMTLKDNAKPIAVGLGLTAVGAVAAEVGAGAARHFIAPVEDFAAQGPVQDALVTAGAGVGLVGLGLVALGLAKGPRFAAPFAAPLAIGVGVVALIDLVKPLLTKVVDGVFGLFGIVDAPAPTVDVNVAPAGLWTQTARGDALRLPAGFYDGGRNRYARTPGALVYGEAPSGRRALPSAATAFGA